MTRDAAAAPFVARNGDVGLSDAPERPGAAAIHASLAASYWSPGIPRATVGRPERFMEIHRPGLYRGASG